jgi:hypothetical protein
MTDELSTVPDEAAVLSGGDATIAVSLNSLRPRQDHLYHGKSGPAAEGARVAEGLRAGPLATIDACVATLESKRRYQGDIEAVTAFLAPLVQAKVLSLNEARLGLASPKLSMLCKIGEYADRLRHPTLLSYFLETGCYGHTQVYQVAVLLDQTGDEQGEEARVPQLVDMLRQKQVETRQDMLRLTRELKRAKLGSASTDLVSGARPTDLVSIDEGDDEFRPGDVFRDTAAVEIDRDFDLILAIPGPSDLRKLQGYYEGPLPRCLRTGQIIAESSALVVIAALADLPVVCNRLLPFCGFGGVSPRVLLGRPPLGPEITDEQVIIVAERGPSERACLSDIAWMSPEELLNPTSLAARLISDAVKKLRLFASETTDGWQCVVGDDNWSVVDE